MRALWSVVVMAVLSGCPFNGIPCADSNQCGDGNTCVDGFCVKGDGGTGGGANTGGGGGATGGGGGTGGATGGGTGGSTGGGTGGGGDLCAGVTCAKGYSCTAGTCFLRVTGIVVDAPTDGLLTNQTTMTVQAHLTMDASVALPESIQVTLNSGAPVTMQGAGNSYTSGAIPVTQQAYTAKVTAAFEDAGVSSRDVMFRVDLEGPMVNPVAAIQGSIFKRDDQPVVALTATEGVKAGTRVTMGGAVMVEEPQGCPGTVVGCWKLDMSKPPLDGLEGDFTVLVEATDLANNAKTSDAGTVHVTRKRWETRLVSNESIRAAPAIANDGTLLVGTSNGPGGTLFAVDPNDGGVAQPATTTLGAVVSLATATSLDAGLVYFTANGATGLVGARLQSSLSQNASAPSPGNNGFTYSAVGLAAGATGEIGAVAAFNNVPSAGRVVSYWPTSGAGLTNAANPVSVFDFSLVPTPSETANNIVVDGSTAYLLTRPAGAGLYRRSITGLTPGNNPSDGTPQTIAAAGNALTYGQAFVAGESLIGGTSTLQSYYRVGTSVVPGNLTQDAENGLVAYDGTRAFGGRGDLLVAFNPATLSDSTGATSLAMLGVGPNIRMSPVLGEKRPGESVGTGYAVASNGGLYVFGLNDASARTWGSVFSTAATGTVTAHPTLDCNRRAGAATATTGVLYVTNASGWVTALIVDSPRLLTTNGAWPKYQRTAGNAGNPDNARFPLNPGCPP